MPWAPDLNQPQPSTVPYANRPLTDRPFPYWSRIYSYDTGANAMYNSMQTEFHHRMRAGLTFSTAWTWAKNLGDTNGPTSTGGLPQTGGGRVTNSLYRAAIAATSTPPAATAGPRRPSTNCPSERPEVRRKLGPRGGCGRRRMAPGGRHTRCRPDRISPPPSAAAIPPAPTPPCADRCGPTGSAQATSTIPTAPRTSTATHSFVPAALPEPDQFNCNVAPIGRFGNSGVGVLLGPGTVNLSMGMGKDFRIAERLAPATGGDLHQPAEPSRILQIRGPISPL